MGSRWDVGERSDKQRLLLGKTVLTGFQSQRNILRGKSHTLRSLRVIWDARPLGCYLGNVSPPYSYLTESPLRYPSPYSILYKLHLIRSHTMLLTNRVDLRVESVEADRFAW
jgi:hypothetical protein